MTRIVTSKLRTPKFRVMYNGLVTPYYYQDKGQSAPLKKGKYSMTLVATVAEIEEFAQDMETVHEDLRSQAQQTEGKKRLTWKEPLGGIYPHVNADGDETGDYLIKLSHADKGINPKTGDEWAINPVVLDSKAQPLKKDVIARIGRGSTVRCSFIARVYKSGSLWGIVYDLSATQLLVPVWYDKASAADDFADDEVEEEGFVAESDEVADF